MVIWGSCSCEIYSGCDEERVSLGENESKLAFGLEDKRSRISIRILNLIKYTIAAKYVSARLVALQIHVLPCSINSCTVDITYGIVINPK